MLWKWKENKNQEKQVMQMKTISHHQQIDAQPVPYQWPLHQPRP